MHKGNNRHKARNSLKNTREIQQRRAFVPTLSAYRPVLISEKDGETYVDVIEKTLRRGLTKSQRNRHRAVYPHEQRLVQVDGVQLASKNFNLNRHDQRGEMIERLAMLMLEGLYGLLKQHDEKVVMKLGNLSCKSREVGSFERPKQEPVIAVSPQGWRGAKAKYNELDCGGSTNVNWVLAREAGVYTDAIEGVNSYIDVADILVEPGVAVIAKRSRTHPYIETTEFESFRSSFERNGEAPQDFILGDPVVAVRTGPGYGDVIEHTFRSLDPTYLPEAA